ncbi:hypothetical protein TNCV_2559021 [Trichonephila clavipes]|nr:hypothetical protein TNCV_2559021 [Trichonephila clavipes]
MVWGLHLVLVYTWTLGLLNDLCSGMSLCSVFLIIVGEFHDKIAEVEIVSPSIVPSGNFAELIRSVTCMVLKVMANDRRTSSPLP